MLFENHYFKKGIFMLNLYGALVTTSESLAYLRIAYFIKFCRNINSVL